MSWRDVGFLVVGLFVGANVGLLVMALCVAARRGDELAQSSRLTAKSEEGTGDGGPGTDDSGRRVVFERKVVISKRRR